MEKIDVEYILHCVRNSRVLLAQNELLKVDGLLNSAQMSLEEQLQNTSSNSDYAKCRKEIMEYFDAHLTWKDCEVEGILKKHFA